MLKINENLNRFIDKGNRTYIKAKFKGVFYIEELLSSLLPSIQNRRYMITENDDHSFTFRFEGSDKECEAFPSEYDPFTK